MKPADLSKLPVWQLKIMMFGADAVVSDLYEATVLLHKKGEHAAHNAVLSDIRRHENLIKRVKEQLEYREHIMEKGLAPNDPDYI